MKLRLHGILALGLVFSCVGLTNVRADDKDEDEGERVAFSGSLKIVKDAEGKISSAKVVTEEMDDELEIVKTVYYIVLDAKGRELCAAFGGKDVVVVGTVKEQVKDAKPQKWVTVTGFSADELDPEPNVDNLDDGE